MSKHVKTFAGPSQIPSMCQNSTVSRAPLLPDCSQASLNPRKSAYGFINRKLFDSTLITSVPRNAEKPSASFDSTATSRAATAGRREALAPMSNSVKSRQISASWRPPSVKIVKIRQIVKIVKTRTMLGPRPRSPSPASAAGRATGGRLDPVQQHGGGAQAQARAARGQGRQPERYRQGVDQARLRRGRAQAQDQGRGGAPALPPAKPEGGRQGGGRR